MGLIHGNFNGVLDCPAGLMGTLGSRITMLLNPLPSPTGGHRSLLHEVNTNIMFFGQFVQSFSHFIRTR